jgi:hypothetical protein
MLAFRYRRRGLRVKRFNLTYITRAHHITKKPTPSVAASVLPVVSPGLRTPSSRRPGARETPSGEEKLHLAIIGEERQTEPGSRLLPSSLKQTHTEETQDGDDPHTSPFEILSEILSLKSCLKSCRTIPASSARQSKSALIVALV